MATTATFGMSRAVSLGGGSISPATGTTLTLSGVVSGSSALNKVGAGTLSLSGTNTYTGGTIISAGTLEVSSSDNLASSGTITLSGGTLATTGTFSLSRGMTLSSAGTLSQSAGTMLTVRGGISGTGGLTKTGAGTLTLAAANSYSGGTTISAGTLKLGAGGATGSISGNVANEGALVFDIGDVFNFAGAISGTGSVTQAGSSTLILTGNNSYSGGTTIADGGIQISSDAKLGASSGGLTMAGGALYTTTDITSGRAVTLTGAGTFVPSGSTTLTLTGAISGAGSLVMGGTGTLTLLGENVYLGGTSIEQGTLRIGDGRTSGSVRGDIANDGTLVFSRSDAISYDGRITGSGRLIHDGSDTLTLTGDSSFTGTTLITSGTLQLGTGGASGSLAGAIANDGALIFNRSDEYSYAGPITGAGSVTVTGGGTLTLGGTNSHAGGTTVTGSATLKVASDDALGDASVPLVLSQGTLAASNSFTSSRTFNIDGPGGTFRPDAGVTLTLDGTLNHTGTLYKAGAGTLVLAGANPYDGSSEVQAGTLQVTTSTISGDIVNDGTVAFVQDFDGTYAGVISASGALTKSGTGTVTLTGTNSYSGGTTISAGTLQIGDGNLTGEIRGDIVNNGALIFNNADLITFSGAISGSGSLTHSGYLPLTLTGANSYTGGTIISAGTLQVGDGGTTGSIVGDVSVASDSTLVFRRSDIISFGGTISGGGGVTQAGPGTLILTGTNRYSGLTRIDGGTLQVAADATLGDPASALLVGGALVTTASFASSRLINMLPGGSFAPADGTVLTLDGEVAGNGALIKNGAGTLVLTHANDYRGGTVVAAGTLQIGADGNLGVAAGGLTLSDATLASIASFASARAVHLGGNARFAPAADTILTLGGVVSGTGALVKSGAGTLILTGANSYGGGTTLAAGTLQIDADARLGDAAAGLTMAGGVLATTGSFVSDRAVTLAGGNFNPATGTTLTLGGILTGAGTLVQSGAGTLILTGANTYAGGTRLSAGTLQVAADANLGDAAGGVTFAGGTLSTTGSFASDRTVALAADATFTPASGTALLLRSGISGTGALTQDGPGTLILGGTNSYSGGTRVTVGTLQIAGSIAGPAWVASGATLGGGGTIGGDVTLAGGATLAPGAVDAPGTLTIGGDLSVGAGATLAFNLAQPNAQASALNDRVTVTGNLSLAGGNITVNEGGLFQPGSYRLVDYGGTLSVTGGGLSLAGLPASLSSSLLQTAVAGQINLIAVADGVSTQWWNGGGIGGSGTITGGAGGWDASAANWSNVNGTSAASWIDGGLAIFTGTAGAVTLGSDVRASGLQFAVPDYALHGANTLTLVAQAGGDAPYVRVDDGSATIDVVVAGAAGLTKTGAGSLVLSGSNSYAGGTSISGGTLQVASDANLGAASGWLALSGATLATTGSFASARGVTLTGNGIFVPGSGTTLTLDGVVGGEGTLTQAGPGTLILGGANSYAGGTRISGGTLQVASDANLGAASGALALSGATLATTGSFVSARGVTLTGTSIFAPGSGTTLTLSGALGGTGTLTQAGPGTLILGGSNAYTGGTSISGGTLQVASDANLGAASGGVTLAGGALATTASFASDRTLMLAGTGTLAPAGGTRLTLGGLVSGNGALVKAGTGTLVLIGTAQHTGGTTLSAGTLQIGDGGTAGSLSSEVRNDAALVFNRADTVEFGGTVTGSGSLTQAGAGTLILSGTNRHQGGTAIVGGTLQVTADGNLGDAAGVLTLDAGTLTTTASFASNRDVTLTGNARIAPADATALTLAGPIAGGGALVKTGGGTLILAGANRYGGGTRVAAGVLQISADTNLGDANTGLTLTDGTLATTASFTSSRSVTLIGNGTVAPASGVTLTLGGALSGAGALTKAGAGTLILTGASDYRGPTTIADGALWIGDGGTGGNLTGAVTNEGTIGFNRADDVIAAGAITGSGALVQRGPGKLTLVGANSAGAGTSVASGTLELLGGVSLASDVVVRSGAALQGAAGGGPGGTIAGTVTIEDGGTLRAGIATAPDGHGLTMAGLTLSAGANLDVMLGAPTGGAVFSAGVLTLDGVLNVTRTGEMAQGVYRILDYTRLAADNGLTLGNVPTDFNYAIQQAPGQVNLAVLNSEMLYWNGTATTADGSLRGGSGNWTSSPAQTNWLVPALDQARAWNGTFAVFSGAAGTVAVVDPVSATGLQFMADGYVLSGGAIALAATSGQTQVRVGDGTAAGTAYRTTIGSTLTGTAGLRKTDLGTLILTGDNSYAGDTSVAQGTLQIGNGGTTGAILGNVTVASGATLAFDRADTVRFAGNIGGAGALTQAGAGTLVLTGANSFTGGTTIAAGVLQVGDGGTDGTLAGPVRNNGVLVFDRADDSAFAGAISGGGTLTKAGAGTLTLSGANSFTGATTVAAGTLAVSGGAALADGARVTLAAATVLRLVDADETIGSLAGTGGVVLNGHALRVGADGTDTRFDGVVAGAGRLVKLGSGTLTLAGTNDAAATSVDSGTLVAEGNGALSDGSAVAVAAGAMLDLQITGTKTLGALSGGGDVRINAATLNVGSDQGSTTFAGTLSGSGGLGKIGTGTLTLTGANRFTGTTTVAAGELALGGSLTGDVEVQDGARLSGAGAVAQTVRVRDGGTLSGVQANGLTMGNLDLEAGARLNVTLGAATGGGVFTVDGDVVLDGTLNVTQAPGFGAGIYRVIGYGGRLTDRGLEVAPLSGGVAGGIQTALAGQVNLLVESRDSTMQFWNGAQSTPRQTVLGGTGTWSAGEQTNWSNASGTIAQAWNGGLAVFQGTAGTVTVDNGAGQVRATGMQFAQGGYRVEGGAIALEGSGPAMIRVGDGSGAGADAVATIASALTGATGMEKADRGRLILTGANRYTGGTTISGGVLQIGDGGTAGAILGDVVNNAALAFNLSGAAQFDGAISGSGTLTQMGSGTLTLTSANSYAGGTTVATGTLRVLSGAALGTGGLTIARGATLRAGDSFAFGKALVLSNAVQGTGASGIEVDANKTLTVSGVISGEGSLEKTGTGTLVLTGANSYTGLTTISAGTLQIGDGGTSGVIPGDIVNNASLVVNRSDSYRFAGSVSGSGTLTFKGGGTVSFKSSVSAPVVVDASVMRLEAGSGSTASFTVNNGGVLGGTATIGGLVANDGSSIAPGYSPGTLTVNGTVTFNAGAIYDVDVTPQGAHDLIVATGNVTLSPQASVRVHATPGRYSRNSKVAILTTSGALTGTFGGVTADYAFLRPSLSYDLQNVYLNLLYNGKAFADFARTPNQRGAATGAQALPDGNPVFEALIQLSETATASAFDQLSGEFYASTSSALQRESIYLREAVGTRLRQTGTEPGVLAAAADAAGPATAALGRALTPTLWAQGYGAWGANRGDGNAATLSSSTGGFLAGLDFGVTDSVRAGIVGGFGQTTSHQAGYVSSATTDNYDMGLYVGGQFGALGLRGGVSYSWHDVRAARTIAFPGFNDMQRAAYGLDTTQLFGEASYRLTLGKAAIEPFANAAYVRVSSGTAVERGRGAAGLAVATPRQQTFYTTVGMRAAALIDLGDHRLTPTLTLGWQRAMGDTVSSATMRFLSGDTPFEVAGVPIVKSMATVGAGLAYSVSDRATLQLNYSGQFADRAHQHAFSGRFSLRF